MPPVFGRLEIYGDFESVMGVLDIETVGIVKLCQLGINRFVIDIVRRIN